ncbi:MAG: AI-2E family transporter [Mucinivorans sp.]
MSTNFANKYRIAAMITGLAVLLFFVWYFHVIVCYILGAAVLSLIGKPLVRLLMRIKFRSWSFPKWAAAVVTLLALIVGILGLAWLFVPVVIDQLSMITSFSPSQISDLISSPMQAIENSINTTFPAAHFSIRSMVSTAIDPLLNSGFVQNIVGSLTSLVAQIAIAGFSIAFITFFFLKDDSLFGQGVVMLFPTRYEDSIKRAMSSSTNLLIRYFIGICIESLIKLIVIALSVYIIGFDLSTSVMIGLVTAVLNVIPYIGPIIGAIIALGIAAVSLLAGLNLSSVVLEISIVLIVFQLLDNIILQPYIYSSSVKAHALEIFIVILMAGYLAGILGMLLAIPAYTVLRVFAKEFFNNIRVVQKLTQKI